jgi:hypothetical protein
MFAQSPPSLCPADTNYSSIFSLHGHVYPTKNHAQLVRGFFILSYFLPWPHQIGGNYVRYFRECASETPLPLETNQNGSMNMRILPRQNQGLLLD